MDQRDAIWRRTYYTFYETYYIELLCNLVISRWQFLNDFTKTLVAITTSGTVISSWALWKNSIGIYLWLVISGFASAISIISATWNATTKIKEWNETRSYCIHVRMSLEILKDKMIINPNFNIDELQQSFFDIKNKFGELKTRLKPDIFLTKSAKLRIQKSLNEIIKNYI